jgi:hypothetical protein
LQDLYHQGNFLCFVDGNFRNKSIYLIFSPDSTIFSPYPWQANASEHFLNIFLV